MTDKSEQIRRWENEARYFDGLEYDSDKLRPEIVERYMKCERPYLVEDYEFVALGDLTGKTVLEVGCGDGWRSIMMAMHGAHVVALDLSSKAIAAARSRAIKHGLQDQIEFHVSPVEVFNTDQRFDIVSAFALLHHLIPVLGATLRELKRFGKPDARYLFVEPISPSRTLRRLRLMMPIAVNGSTDERPLEPAELDTIRASFARTKITYYYALSRISRRVFKGPLETMHPMKRDLYLLAGRVDRFLLQTLRLHWLASVAFIEAQS